MQKAIFAEGGVYMRGVNGTNKDNEVYSAGARSVVHMLEMVVKCNPTCECTTEIDPRVVLHSPVMY